ncbi:MAG: hypothetical protein U0667_04680 [Chloroflexota bacterium]
MAYLWAAHPLFTRSTTTDLVLPDAIGSLDIVGGLAAGTSVAVDDPIVSVASDADLGRSAIKLYVPPDTPCSWAALEEPQVGIALRLDWDSTMIRYLGIWIDRGRYTPSGAVAIEPTNGYHDDLARAWQAGRVAHVDRSAAAEWWLAVTMR